MTDRATFCHMPEPAPRDEADIMRAFRGLIIRAHCAAHRAHKCCGQITITRDYVTFNCNLCGDARQIIVEGDE